MAASTRWLVVLAREALPIEVWGFGDESEAQAWYDYVGTQWSEIYLCRVEAGPGNPPPSIPLHPLQVEAARAREETRELDQRLRILAAIAGCPASDLEECVRALRASC